MLLGLNEASFALMGLSFFGRPIRRRISGEEEIALLRRWRQSTFRVFLLSYVVIALLPMLVVTVVYFRDVTSSLNQSMMDRSLSAAQSAMTSLETHLAIIEGIPYQLYTSNAVRNYRWEGDTLSRSALIDELRRVIGRNNLIKDVYLYFRQRETFVSAYNNSLDKASILTSRPNGSLNYRDMDTQTLLDMLENLSGHRVLAVSPVTSGMDSARNMVTFLQTLPPENSYSYASVLILVDANELSKLLCTSGDGGYMLFSETGLLVASYHAEDYDATQMLALAQAHGSVGAQNVHTDAGNVIASHVWSSTTGWTLIQFTSTDELIAELRSAHIRGIVILAVALLVTTYLIILFMKRTYGPVRSLAFMAESVQGDTAANGTAFDTLGNALHALQAENNLLKTHIRVQNPLMAEYAARTLLSTPAEEFDQRAFEAGRQAGLRLDCAHYQVLVMHFISQEEQDTALKGLIERCGNDYVISFAETARNRIVFVIGGDGEDSLHPHLSDNMPHGAVIGIGPQVDGVLRWNESYVRASLAYEYAVANPNRGSLMLFEEIPEEAYSHSNYPWLLIQTLSASINQKNTDIVRNTGEQIADFLRNPVNGITEEKRMTFLQTVLLFQDFLPDHAELIASYARLFGLREERMSQDDMAAALMNLVMAYCNREDASLQSSQKSPIYRSLNVISMQIGSEQLSLAGIAETVGLSVSRYSTLFRQEMGCTFKEYVDALRVSSAKQLLRETDLRISDIGANVGYTNAYSFARLFKSKTGMSPNTYRENCHNGQAPS